MIDLLPYQVAPFAGAWIEIGLRARKFGNDFVAPFAGAWIEMPSFAAIALPHCGRSLRGSVD